MGFKTDRGVSPYDNLDKLPGFPLGAQDIQNGAVTTGKVATGTFLELLTTGTARKVTWGSSSVSFSAASVSATNTVTHGLPGAPVIVLPVVTQNTNVWLNVTSKGATTFNVIGVTTSSVTATINFDWLAIG